MGSPGLLALHLASPLVNHQTVNGQTVNMQAANSEWKSSAANSEYPSAPFTRSHLVELHFLRTSLTAVLPLKCSSLLIPPPSTFTTTPSSPIMAQNPPNQAPPLPVISLRILSRQQRAQHRAALLNAGPQYNPRVTPWTRPRHSPAQGPSPPWQGFPANYTIPLHIAIGQHAHIDSTQPEVNTFLRNLQQLLDQQTTALVWASGLVLGRGVNVTPRIYHLEVSSLNPQNREDLFVHFRQGQNTFFGEPGDPRVPLPLSQYSGTVRDAQTSLALRAGTIYTFASPQQRQGLLQSSHLRSWLRANPGVQPTAAQLADFNRGRDNEDLWHQTGLLIYRRQDFPRAGNNPNHWSNYTFNTTVQLAMVYDSSWVNENIVTGQDSGRATASYAATNQQSCRLSDFIFMSTVHHFLFNNPRGLAQDTCRWLRTPGTVKVGGGGNYGPMDSCRVMTSIWMDQVSELTIQLNHAIEVFKHQPSQANMVAFNRAHTAFTQFFRDYRTALP